MEAKTSLKFVGDAPRSGYTGISNLLLRRMTENGYRDALAVYEYILSYSEEYASNMNQRTLREKLGIGENKMKRIFDELKSIGLITIKRHGKDWHYTVNKISSEQEAKALNWKSKRSN